MAAIKSASGRQYAPLRKHLQEAPPSPRSHDEEAGSSHTVLIEAPDKKLEEEVVIFVDGG